MQGANAFSRERKLPLKHLVGCLLHKSLAQCERGYQLLTANYFAQLERSEKIVSLCRSSFCEARDKLSWRAFEFLFKSFSLENRAGFEHETWHGHRIRGVDGTFVQLPFAEDLKAKFPPCSGSGGSAYYPSARLLVAADIFTSQPTHALVSGKLESERSLLKKMLKDFKAGDISILDRGFPGAELYKVFEDFEQHYICRSNKARIMSRDSPKLKDEIVSIKTADGDDLWVRVIRGQRLRTGEYFYLETNLLDQIAYPRAEVLALYKKRQAIEDVFLNLKATLNVRNIRSKKLNGVLQEIFAALTMASLTAATRYLFELGTKARRMSFKAIAWRFTTVFSVLFEPLSEVELQSVFDGILKFNHRKQPGRSYPRYSRQPLNKWVIEKRNKKYRAGRRAKRS